MKTVTNLRIGVGIDPRDLDKGAARVRKSLRQLSSIAKVAGVAAGVAFTGAAVGMGAMAKRGLEVVDAQAKMARSVDGTVDGLRALQIAGGDAGVAAEAIGSSMQKMGAKLAEAARDGFGPTHEALEMLGLSAEDLLAQDVDSRLAAIADQAQHFGLNAQQTADILAQLGVRNKEMALLVAQGGTAIRAAREEVKDFGLSLDRDAVAGVERANDAMARIGFVFEGFQNQLAVAVAPALEAAAQQFKSMMQVGGPLQSAISQISLAFGDLIARLADPAFLQAATNIGVNLMGAIEGAATVLVVLSDNAEIAGAAMVALGAAMAFFSGPIGLAIAAVAGGIGLLATSMGNADTVADELAIAEHDLSVAIAAVDRKNRDAVLSTEARISGLIDQARAAASAAEAEYQLARAEATRALDQQRMQAEGPFKNLFSREMIAQAEEDLELVDEYYDELIGKHQAQVQRLSKTLEGFQRSKFPSQGVGRGNGTVPPPADNPGLTFQTELDALIRSLDPAVAKSEQFESALRILDRAKREGALSQEEYNLRVDQLKEKLEGVPEVASSAAGGLAKIKEELDASDQINEQFADGMDAAMKRLINNMEGGMSAVRAFALEVVKLLAIRGISKLLGGSDWFDGAVFTPIGKNALGTDHWRGGLSWVGERGPELVDLPRGSKVIPNHRLGGIGGGSSFTYAPVIDARGADAARVAELEQTMKAEARQLDAKVVRAVRRAQQSRVF